MPTYLSPGVYVEEVPSGSAPIAGAGTSTPGFIGVITYKVVDEVVGTGNGTKTTFDLSQYPVSTDSSTYTVNVESTKTTGVTLSNDATNKQSQVSFTTAPASGTKITVDYKFTQPIENEVVGTGNGSKTTFNLTHYPVLTDSQTLAVKVGDTKQTRGVSLSNDAANKQSQVIFTTAPARKPITVDYKVTKPIENEAVGTGNGSQTTFALDKYPVLTNSNKFTVKVDEPKRSGVHLENQNTPNKSQVIFDSPPASGAIITVNYQSKRQSNDLTKDYLNAKVQKEKVGTGDGHKTTFTLSQYPVLTTSGTFAVKVGNSPGTGVELENDDQKQQSRVKFTGTAPAASEDITVDYQPSSKWAGAGEVKLVTNFGEFKKFFGDFSELKGQNTLAHAVYGFFRNGGTRCYVTWVALLSEIDKVLDDSFAAIDEIALVAAPGLTDKGKQGKISDHCKKLGDRFAILDSPEEVETSSTLDLTKFNTGAAQIQPGKNDYAAYYFPWIQVYDPASQTNKYVPPSGHMAGIYARVDTQRGVHKSPANEVILGALDLKYKIGKPDQDGLNPQGINCIRNLNGNILVWGARTLGGDQNGEYKYISVRRLLIYLRESIDEGTQWVVFEPNTPALWAKIRSNITAFLTNVWRSGALFGATPEQAFFVKCDEENNPPEVRDLGQLVTTIGVAVVKPAEFVIFRISQWAGPSGS